MENPIFIVVTGQKSGVKVRVNINTITKYRENDGGTGFYTYKDNGTPYMIAKESPAQIDKLIAEAIATGKPSQYTLKP